ncbi:RloB family protein [Fibrella sp. WM1]|uniref:RloB family protein n=1 Tax=Fibrella musci TaxID=3242485 RepID=UPI0035217BDE
MARKSTINTSRFARQETPRGKATKSIRKFFLIVCEGAKTEPNYFEGIKKDLPPNVVRVADFKAAGTGKNTLSVIDEAERLLEQHKKSGSTQPIDEVWVVFDRDSFPKQHINAAITQAVQKGMHCAWTNEAFELWYILHFQLVEHAMSRNQYQKVIERELTRCLGKPYKYQKNSEAMFALLMQHGDIEQAIKRAERLAESFGDRTDYADHNPRTEVHRLIKKLLQFK